MGRSLKIAVTVFLASMGIVSSVDAALIGATATFRENSPTSPNDGPGPDEWEFSLAGATAPGFYIQSLKWILPSSPQQVFFDTAAGGAGHGAAYDFLHVDGVNPASIDVDDGGHVLELVFLPNAFGAGDFIKFTIDVDDDNEAVRGWIETNYAAIGGSNTNPIPANPAEEARRTLLEITYFNGNELTTTSTYFYGTGSQNAGTARASATLVAVPEPTTWALWTLGLVGSVVAKRRRRRS